MARYRKNASGAGTIRRRSKNCWEGRFTTGFDQQTGKQIQDCVYGKTQIRNHIKPRLGKYRLSDLSPHMVQAFVNAMLRGDGKTEPLSAKTPIKRRRLPACSGQERQSPHHSTCADCHENAVRMAKETEGATLVSRRSLERVAQRKR